MRKLMKNSYQYNPGIETIFRRIKITWFHYTQNDDKIFNKFYSWGMFVIHDIL